ncbi:hypothetical protein AB0M83_27830 [Amycolatopsis sp. NPDC051106]|uniref:hypothetical protein n=1 Tax=unclassified Amycolatopsis TaxID=2618356 RepID=UPI0034375CCE
MAAQDAYLWECADRLDDRGIDAPFPGLPRIALVDVLADHGLLAEVDGKEVPGKTSGRADAVNDPFTASDAVNDPFLSSTRARTINEPQTRDTGGAGRRWARVAS